MYADVKHGIDTILHSSPETFRSAADEMWEWANHPDERISLAMADLRTISLPHGILEVLAQRALDTARRERAVWTPVLDALLVRSQRDRSMRFGGTQLSESSEHALWRRFAKMEAWVRAAPDYRATLSLLTFPSYAVHEMILRHARHLPAEWIAYSSEQHPKLLLDVRRIPSLHPNTAKALFELTLERAQSYPDDDFFDVLLSLEALAGSHVFSITDCSSLEALLATRCDTDDKRSGKLGILLRRHLVSALSGASRAAQVQSADLSCLLRSPCEAIRFATQEFVAEMEFQPV